MITGSKGAHSPPPNMVVSMALSWPLVMVIDIVAMVLVMVQ